MSLGAVVRCVISGFEPRADHDTICQQRQAGYAMRLFMIVAVGSLMVTSSWAEEMSGSQVAAIYDACQKEALRQCPKLTIRCQAFQRGFVKMCLVKNGVPADMVLVLTTN